MKGKKFLIWILHQIHVLIMLFVLFGWLYPSSTWRLIHLVFVPAMVFQWWLNKGDCYLTNLEHYLLHEDKKPQEDSAFIRSLLKRIGWQPEEKTLLWVIYGLVNLVWGLNLVSYLGFVSIT